MAETRTIILSIFALSIFGFALMSFITGVTDDSNSVTVDENYTKLSNTFQSTIDNVTEVGNDMRNRIEAKGGFTVTSAGFILLNSMYAAAKWPFKIIKTIPTLTSNLSDIFAIPVIYINAIFTVMIIILSMALISLLFRKDF